VNREILERRLEMLDMSFSGVRTSEWIPILAHRYSVTESAVWSDWGRRDRWLPQLFSLEKGAYKVSELLGRLELAITRAFGLMMSTNNESVKIGSMRTVDSISKTLYTLGVESGTYPSLLKDLMTKLVKLEEEAKR